MLWYKNITASDKCECKCSYVRVNFSTPGESESPFSNLGCSIKKKEQGASFYVIPDLTKPLKIR